MRRLCRLADTGHPLTGPFLFACPLWTSMRTSSSPDFSAGKPPFKRYPTLDQNAALNSQASSLLIDALAGTGKTSTLAIKAADLIQHRGAERILMLAYSEAGLKAIQARLAQFVPELPTALRVMTVEQLCAEVLQAQGDPVPTLDNALQRNLLIRQAHAALEQDQLRHHDGALADYLARALDINAFLAFEALAKQRLLLRDLEESGMGAAAYCEEKSLDYGLLRLVQKYERLRTGLNDEPVFYAPGDCTYALACQLGALGFDDAFPWLKGRFDAVLFDELQDLDEAALLVLRHLARGGNGSFIGVGDFNQHILPGAFSVFGDGAQRILQELPADTQRLSLRTSYRFGSAICHALNPLFGVQLEAHHARKPAAFEARSYQSDSDCIQQLLDIHRSVLHTSARPNAAPARLHVIVRSPEDSVLLEWMLAHEGVHYACKGMQRFYQRREIALVLAILWAMPGSNGGAVLSHSILNNAIEGQLHYAPRSAALDGDQLANGLFDLSAALGESAAEVDTRAVAAEIMGQPARMRRILTMPGSADSSADSSVYAQLLDLPATACADAGQLCQHPLMEQVFRQAPISPQELETCLRSLHALAGIAQGLSVDEFLGRLSLMVQSSIAQYQRQEVPSLHLLTVERSKGHEFENVVVPLVARGRFPRSTSREDPHRERNMLYVAMTRASHRLWLLESAKRPVSPGPV